MRGVLLKRTRWTKLWKQRLFVLTPAAIEYHIVRPGVPPGMGKGRKPTARFELARARCRCGSRATQGEQGGTGMEGGSE